METIRTALVSALLDNLAISLYIFTLPYTYMVDKYKMYLNSLWNWPKRLTRGSFFFQPLKLVQINLVHSMRFSWQAICFVYAWESILPQRSFWTAYCSLWAVACCHLLVKSLIFSKLAGHIYVTEKGQAVSFDSSCATTGCSFWGVVRPDIEEEQYNIQKKKKIEIQIIKLRNECD